jgi:hypothetical protein
MPGKARVTLTGGATRAVQSDFSGDFHTFHTFNYLGGLLPNMRRVCTLKADLSNLANSLKVQKGPRGQDFWRVEHSVAVLFGGTQLRARLQWYEGVSLIHYLWVDHQAKSGRFRISYTRGQSV